MLNNSNFFQENMFLLILGDLMGVREVLSQANVNCKGEVTIF